jgi:hypothetical protein
MSPVISQHKPLLILKTMSSPICASVLLITKGTCRYKHCPTFASIKRYSSLYSSTIVNHKNVRYSVSMFYSTNIYQFKMETKDLMLHYGLDMVFIISRMLECTYSIDKAVRVSNVPVK